MIYEDDLMTDTNGNLCLLLRFKNCTGNVIDFQAETLEVSEQELALSHLTLSIDPKFKNQRTRTVS